MPEVGSSVDARHQVQEPDNSPVEDWEWCSGARRYLCKVKEAFEYRMIPVVPGHRSQVSGVNTSILLDSCI